MPNWCENTLTITHKDANVIDNLVAQVRAGDGDLFQFIKPMPEELRDTTSPSDSPNWYDWCVDEWGTKWDACELSEHQLDPNTLHFVFQTAWSPPIGVYEALAKQGFEVEAYYLEYGMMFAGEWHCDGDGEISDVFVEDISEGVTENLDEIFNITETLAEWAAEEEEENVA